MSFHLSINADFQIEVSTNIREQNTYICELETYNMDSISLAQLVVDAVLQQVEIPTVNSFGSGDN